MKTIFLSVITAILLAFSGCKEREKYLRIVEDDLVIAAEELTVEINVEASAEWMVDVSALDLLPWIREFGYAANGKTFTIAIAEANATLEARSVVLRVDSGDGLSRSITLTQLAMDASIGVTPAALEPFDGHGELEQTLIVDAYPEEWTVDEDVDWLTVTRGEGDLYNTLTLIASRSPQLEERSGEIVVRHIAEAFESLADTIIVTQNGVNLRLYDDPESDLTIDALALEVTLPSEGIDKELKVYAIADWTVRVEQPEAGRVTLGVSGGVMDDLDGVALPIVVPENTVEETYEFTLIFDCGGERYEYRCTQAAFEPDDPEGDDN